MGYGAAGGSVTPSKIAAKMAAILDFTKSSKFSGKLGNCKYVFDRVVKYDTIKLLLLLVAFYKFLHRRKKLRDHMLFMTSYTVSDSRQTLLKYF